MFTKNVIICFYTNESILLFYLSSINEVSKHFYCHKNLIPYNKYCFMYDIHDKHVYRRVRQRWEHRYR